MKHGGFHLNWFMRNWDRINKDGGWYHGTFQSGISFISWGTSGELWSRTYATTGHDGNWNSDHFSAGKPSENGGFMWFYGIYPSGNDWHSYEFPLERWWFSSSLCVYQRVFTYPDGEWHNQHFRCESSTISNCARFELTTSEQTSGIAGWNKLLVGGLEHLLFSYILGIIIPIDFHIFQRGNHQPELWRSWFWSGRKTTMACPWIRDLPPRNNA